MTDGSEGMGAKTVVDGGRRCERCGYNLTGLTATRCPECAFPFDPNAPIYRTDVGKNRARARVCLAALGALAVYSIIASIVTIVEWIELQRSAGFMCGVYRATVEFNVYCTHWWRPIAACGIGLVGWRTGFCRVSVGLVAAVPLLCSLIVLGVGLV